MGIFESLSTSDSSNSSPPPPKIGFGFGRKKGKDIYFLDSCSLCKRSLIGGDDIYMYRGDTAFCSEECRQEQIENDNSDERRRQRKSLKERNNSSVSSLRSEKVIHAAATVVG